MPLLMSVSKPKTDKQTAKSDKPVPRWVLGMVLLLLCCHAYLVARQITELSPVGPEINHMVRGSEALLGDCDGLGRHPHPYDYIVGLQLLNNPGEHRPTSPDRQLPIAQQLDIVTRQWVHTGLFGGSNSPLYAARYSTLLLSVVLALLVFATSRKRWGDHGGLVSLTLYCFSPAILANAPLATPDIANAFILMALASWTWRTGCRLSKTDLPAPLWAIMLILLVGIMQTAMAGKPRPTELWGGSWYLNGTVFPTHPGGYYLYIFMIKTSIATLVLLMIAQVAWLMSKGTRRRDVQHSWPMICIIISTLYTATHVTEPIGWRLLLPLYPALFVLAGSVMRPARNDTPSEIRRTKNARLMSLLCITLLVLQTLIFPQHFLTFTNQAARQQDAIFPHLAVDNLDWGQDHHIAAGQADYLASFGPMSEADPATHEKSLLQWSDKPLSGGRYVISSNYLAGATPDVLPAKWTLEMEQTFLQLHDYFVSGLLKMPENSGHQHQHGMTKLTHEQWMYLRLRLARLCAHLRVRQPDRLINKTMLVYDVSDEQVAFMLETPPYEKTDIDLLE